MLQVFKLLAQHGALQKITLGFYGKSPICSDYMRFLWYLGMVKANEIEDCGREQEGACFLLDSKEELDVWRVQGELDILISNHRRYQCEVAES